LIDAICAYWNGAPTDVSYCTHIAPVAGCPTFTKVPAYVFTGKNIVEDCPDVIPVKVGVVRTVLPFAVSAHVAQSVTGRPPLVVCPCGTNIKFTVAQEVPVFCPNITPMYPFVC